MAYTIFEPLYFLRNLAGGTRLWFKILSLQTLRPSCYSSEAQCSAEEKLSSNWKPFYCSPARNKLPRGSSVGTSNPFEIEQPISSKSPPFAAFVGLSDSQCYPPFCENETIQQYYFTKIFCEADTRDVSQDPLSDLRVQADQQEGYI